MDTLRIALAQVNATVGDFSGNSRKVVVAAVRAKSAGADIVAFPELALCGYPPEDLLLKPRFLRDCRRALEQIAPKTKGITVVIGFPDSSGAKAYNAAAVIEDGAISKIYHKVELPNYGVFDEKRYFAPGARAATFTKNGVPVGITICEDIWVDDGLAESLSGAGVILNVSASPFHAGKSEQRSEVVTRFAERTGAVVCYCNLVGGQDELVFDGGSFAVDASGQVLASAKRFEEDLLLVDVGPGRPPGRVEPELGKTEEVYRALVVGTRDYLQKNGFHKALIGISGGIDSAVTAAIAADALGRDNVLGVTMPSRYTSDETRSDAAVVASSLGIGLMTVPIEPAFLAYSDMLKDAFGAGGPGVEMENIQARIRGNILMALSNRFGWLVLTTGNKSETAVGYCTLYGDMAGGFAVIKDVPKTLVYEVAEFMNSAAGRDVIPRSVIDRPPSAELKPDQKDTDSLPPYPVLDEILRRYVEEDAAPVEIAAAGFDRNLVGKIVRMVARNEYKRRQAPPGIKITPKAFGRDRRLPMTNRYRAGCAEGET